MNEIENPKGHLLLRTLAMPADSNANGDIFGGWLMGLMDLASAHIAPEGKSATRAANNIEFLKAVQVGELVSCYGHVLKTGRTSVTVHVDVYVNVYVDVRLVKGSKGKCKKGKKRMRKKREDTLNDESGNTVNSTQRSKPLHKSHLSFPSSKIVVVG